MPSIDATIAGDGLFDDDTFARHHGPTLADFLPVQSCRCIIGSRRELIQIRAGGCARKKGSRAVLSRKFVRSSSAT